MIEVPVLICGAGGAGLTAAVTLSRYGVSAWVVDRRTEASSFREPPL
jgi:thioredoxin reductase